MHTIANMYGSDVISPIAPPIIAAAPTAPGANTQAGIVGRFATARGAP